MSDLIGSTRPNPGDPRTSGDAVARVREAALKIARFLEDRAFPILPAHEKSQFESKLHAILGDLARPPDISVALLGSSGVGKSTLLNALVGVPILSEDDRRFCTAAVTILRYSGEPGFRATLRFSSLEQWERELNVCRGELDALQEDVGEDGDLESKELFRYYREKLRHVYGLAPEQRIDFSALSLPEDVRQLMVEHDKPLVVKETEVRDFKARLKEYVTSKGRYWPLIQTVEIEGPFDVLQRGVQLVDLPGVNDPNPAREEVTRHYLRSAPHIWLVFNTRRGITKDVREFMLEPDLLRQFLMEGKVDTLTLVGTHAESVDASEDVLREYGLDPDASPDQLVRARNAEVIIDVKAALKEIAEAVADRAGEGPDGRQGLQRRLGRTPVFTVASKDYQKLRRITRGGNPPILSEHETQIPDLIEHLRRTGEGQDVEAHAAEIEKRLEVFLKEVRFCFRNWKQQLSDREAGAKQRRVDLRARCHPPYEKLQRRLREAVETARRTFEARQEVFGERLGSAVERSKRQLSEVISAWTQMHWATLRATVSRGGAFVSPSTGQRFNLNEDVCRPLLSSIPFVWDDFFGAQLDKLLAVAKESLEGQADLFIAELQVEALRSHLVEAEATHVIESGLDVAKEALSLQINNAKAALEQTIRQTRLDLSGDIAVTIGRVMMPAYERAKNETGKGLKQRMLAVLQQHANASVAQMFDTIHRDLSEGVGILGGQLANQLGRLEEYVLQQAERVLQSLIGAGMETPGIDIAWTLQAVDGVIDDLRGYMAIVDERSVKSNVG